MIAATTPTAREVLRSLDRLCAQAQYASLATLDEDGRAHVRAMLSQASPRARVDITLLVEFVRARISRPSRDEIEAAIIARLAAIAERLGGHPPSSRAEVMALAMFPPGPTNPKSKPRVPSRRALDSVAGPDPADPAPASVRRASDAPNGVARASFLGGPRLLGPGDPDRPLGMPDRDPDYEPSTPPWLLTDDDDLDEEMDDDVIAET